MRYVGGAARSPRRSAPSSPYLAESHRVRLPKADIGKSCVLFKRLDDLDEKVLREMIHAAAKRPAASAP